MLSARRPVMAVSQHCLSDHMTFSQTWVMVEGRAWSQGMGPEMMATASSPKPSGALAAPPEPWAQAGRGQD